MKPARNARFCSCFRSGWISCWESSRRPSVVEILSQKGTGQVATRMPDGWSTLRACFIASRGSLRCSSTASAVTAWYFLDATSLGRRAMSPLTSRVLVRCGGIQDGMSSDSSTPVRERGFNRPCISTRARPSAAPRSRMSRPDVEPKCFLMLCAAMAALHL